MNCFPIDIYLYTYEYISINIHTSTPSFKKRNLRSDNMVDIILRICNMILTFSGIKTNKCIICETLIIEEEKRMLPNVGANL